MGVHDDSKPADLAAVAALLADGGDIDSPGLLKRTRLHTAAENGHMPIVDLLLSEHAQVDALDYKKRTPLHLAAGLGSANVVRALLDRGASANARDTYQCTPLHELAGGGAAASADDRIEIVDRLIAAGAELDALDTAQRTPLWFAAATGTAPRPPEVMTARLAVVRRLLELGASQRAAQGQLGTPLDVARGLHQRKEYRLVWPEAVALLERWPIRSVEP